MSAAPPSLRDLAQELLAPGQPASRPGASGVSLVSDNLRDCITGFAGADGFKSLLRRALTLTGRHMPALREARIDADGRVEGLERAVVQDDTMLREAAFAVTVHLLELLGTLLGEPLMRRLVREALEISPEE